MASLVTYVSTTPAVLWFELDGRPESQSRPGGRVIRYNPKKPKIKAIRADINSLIGSLSLSSPQFPTTKFLSVEMIFHMPRPRAHVRNNSVSPRFLQVLAGLLPKRKIDLDNLAKLTLDAMIGPVYSDDSQVVHLSCWKLYDNVGECKGRTEVKVTQIVHVNQLTMTL